MPAKIYAPPEEVGPAPEYSPSIPYEVYQRSEEEYMEKVAAFARSANPHDPYAGKFYSYPVADGNAMYVILKAQTSHAHPPSHWGRLGREVVQRGLTLADIDKYLHFQAIFTKKE